MLKIIGIKIIDRIKEAGLTQEILSKHSSIITTRLGFHELTTELCSREAYMLIHLSCTSIQAGLLSDDLRLIGGIQVSEMSFDDKKPFRNFATEEGALRILGMLVQHKDKETIMEVQKIMTSFGCVIRTRLGVNEDFFGEPAGLILLELMGDEIQMDLLEEDLQRLPDVILRKMVI